MIYGLEMSEKNMLGPKIFQGCQNSSGVGMGFCFFFYKKILILKIIQNCIQCNLKRHLRACYTFLIGNVKKYSFRACYLFLFWDRTLVKYNITVCFLITLTIIVHSNMMYTHIQYLWF